jgi:HD-like signal output (HDOD) protein
MFGWLQRLFSPSGAPAAAPVAVASTAPAPRSGPRLPQEADVSWMQRSVVDYEFTSWLFEAENHPDLFTNQTEDAILAALEDVVNSPHAGAHLVRRMPGVIPQLLQSLRSPDFSGAELARKIWHDVVLVAEVLRLANSAAYSPSTPISSIDRAILILGQNGLRQLITSVAFKPIIDLKSGGFTRRVAPRLWDQAERCAVANRLLAQGSGVDPLEAFLAGLIHNVGLTVSLRAVDQMSDGKQPIGSPTFCNALATYGRTLSANIGREWHFPEAVTTAAREAGVADADTVLSPLGRILQMGDYLSKLDMLRRQGSIAADDPRLSEGLSEKELDCLTQLTDVEDRDWSNTTMAGA